MNGMCERVHRIQVYHDGELPREQVEEELRDKWRREREAFKEATKQSAIFDTRATYLEVLEGKIERSKNKSVRAAFRRLKLEMEGIKGL